MEPLYATTAVSSGDGRNGTAALADGSMQMEMALPKELGGSGQGANPEQLFALGYATCFHSALKLVARRMKRSTEESAVIAEVGIGLGEADTPFALAVKLEVELPALTPEEAQELVEAAHQVCPYSAATRGNIPVEVSVA
jgi:osmotically inducible protein OsmC